MISFSFSLLILLFIHQSIEFYVFNSDNPFKNNKLTCADLKNVQLGKIFAHGQKKEVVHGHLKTGEHDLDVVIARPFRGDFWTDNKKGFTRRQLEEHYDSYFAAERRLLTKCESDFAPHFYGGCWASFGTTIHIEEYLRGYMDAAADKSVTWQQRVRIAIGTVRLLTFFDNFPVTLTTQSKCVYGDLFAKQFAIDSEYHVKVVDMQSFFPYNGTGFGSNYRCTSHDQCQAKFWYSSGYPSVMRGLRKIVPDDFDCDLTRGQCQGLDTRTTLMAFCHLLIEPMFLFVEDSMPKLARMRFAQIMQRCLEKNRKRRATPDELIVAFEELVPARAKLPSLRMVNAASTQYAEIKEKFEKIRHELEPNDRHVSGAAVHQPHPTLPAIDDADFQYFQKR